MPSYSWNGVTGDWNVAANWTPSGGPPTSSDSATISATSSAYTVTVDSADVANSLTLSSATATLNDDGAGASLTIGGTLAISAGTFNLATTSVASGALTVGALNLSGGALTINAGGRLNLGGAISQTGGTLTLAGGTIAGGTIQSTAGTLALNSGTLSGATFDGPLNLTSTSAQQRIHLANGSTVAGSSGSGPGTINVTGQNTILYLDNTQTLSNDTINLGNASTYDFLANFDTASAGGQVLTLASSVTINVVGDAELAGSGASGDEIVNQGFISQTASGSSFYISPLAFTNSGTIDAAAASGQLILNPATFTNNGAIDVANGESVTIEPTTFSATASSLIAIGANSSVTIAPSDSAWTNLGSITLASGANLYLYGSLSAASLGSVADSGGAVDVGGTWNNSGQTLDGSAAFGRLTLYGGAIGGGTATSAGVAFSSAGGTLSGLTFEGPLSLTSAQQIVHLANGATVVGSAGSGPGTINVTGQSSALYFDNTQTVGSDTINLGSASGPAYLEQDDTIGGAQVLTLASTVALHVSGNAQIVSGYASGDAIVNQGVIDQTGGALTIAGAAFTNSGAFELGGGTLTSTASLTNSVGASISGTGTITAATFTNLGTIEASGGTLTLTNAVTGTGGLKIDGSADLVVGGAIASGATATFNGANATLTLDQTSTFGATVGGISVGDVIDLVGVTANGATVNGSNQLVVTQNGTTVATLQLDGAYSGFTFVTQPVSGGTDIVVQQNGGLPNPATVAQYLANVSGYDQISGGFSISNSAANIAGGLDQLNDTHINTITISDSALIGVTVAQLTSDATAIGKLANANANAYQLAVTDSAANITGGLDGLNGSHIASITISDNNAIGVTVAQLTSDATAIGKLANANPNPYQLAVTDTAADITAGLDSLDGSNIASITISDNNAIGVTVAQLTSDATAIGKLANANANAYQLAVTDSLSAIIGDLSGLNGNSHINSLTGASGAATLSSGTIAAGAFALTGSSTALTLGEILTYSGTFNVGAGSTLGIASGDGLTETAAVVNNGLISLSGGTLTSSGAGSSLTDAAGSTLSGYGTVTATTFANAGTIEASGGTLTLTNAVTGTGGLKIDGGADLEVGGAIASGATATFNGANATLTLDQASTFGATIGGISANDTIDLVGITANGAMVNGSNQLVVTENGTTVATLQLDGAYSGFTFVPQSVSGGTDIVATQNALQNPATVAQYLANVSGYDQISGGFAISDSAANIAGGLDQLNDTHINKITISDNGRDRRFGRAADQRRDGDRQARQRQREGGLSAGGHRLALGHHRRSQRAERQFPCRFADGSERRRDAEQRDDRGRSVHAHRLLDRADARRKLDLYQDLHRRRGRDGQHFDGRYADAEGNDQPRRQRQRRGNARAPRRLGDDRIRRLALGREPDRLGHWNQRHAR